MSTHTISMFESERLVRGDALVDQVLAEGVIQPILFALESDL